MTSIWTCPDCSGGFPYPIKWQGHHVCPWCYEKIAKHHNGNELERAREDMSPAVVSRVESKDSDGKRESMMDKLRG